MNTIKSFTDLVTWQKGHTLVIEVYKTTQCFPNEERFGLTNQIRRACVSFTSNIAEGFGRNTYKEKTQFYYMALGSMYEVQNQLLVARDIGFLSVSDFDKLSNLTVEITKITNGLIKSSKKLS